ncbi:hypothetical protein Aph02nite_44420 [Actinoplanes philippinensis]|uniref:Uncharacterized protein n=1 Tax=Actinoplanes philippinensis TaxID=35752 RepID=A0A1I2I8M8_9ACTN|nr:hypothetical protein [Actinoplanes philippinensis]GIE78492.1 hypothetical protein Aph02nite_44420 [Actinoplanes philippinensis]SFF38615.1 hypothetical protein SAMN05421541_109435 [Actinoplanes philippinensis]
MPAVDRMESWRRGLMAGVLAAFAVTMLDPHAAHAGPGVAPTAGDAQVSPGPAEADLRFELKVRLIGEFPELSDGSIPASDREALLTTRLAERWSATR